LWFGGCRVAKSKLPTPPVKLQIAEVQQSAVKGFYAGVIVWSLLTSCYCEQGQAF
jgi:hypothetical protein